MKNHYRAFLISFHRLMYHYCLTDAGALWHWRKLKALEGLA
jgi:hypothetical protein